MPNLENEIDLQDEWTANYLRGRVLGRVAHPSNYVREKRNETTLTENAYPKHAERKTYEADDRHVTFKHNFETTDRQGINILPSEIGRRPCYVNYRFCTDAHNLRHAFDTQPRSRPVQETAIPSPRDVGRPHVTPPKSYSHDEGRPPFTPPKSYSSNYMRTLKYGDRQTQTPDIRRRDIHAWLLKEGHRGSTSDRIKTSPDELKKSTDGSRLRRSDVDDDFSSTKSQCGSYQRVSDLDDCLSLCSPPDARLRYDVEGNARPFRDSAGKYPPGLWEQAPASPQNDKVKITPRKDSSDSECGSFEKRRLEDVDTQVASDQPSSPLYILKRHDSPSCDKQTYSVLTYEQSNLDNARTFTPQMYDAWARVQAPSGEFVLGSSEECSPSSDDQTTDDAEGMFIIKTKIDVTNDTANQGTYTTNVNTKIDTQTDGHIEGQQDIEDEEYVFEKTKVTVVHDSWDPVDQYKSTKVEVKRIPFISIEELDKTKSDCAVKSDKSTMVHMRHRPSDQVCAGCKLHSKINIKRMSNYDTVGDYLRKLYIHDQLCDVIIHVGSYTFSAHRLVLAAHSAYFADMFLENCKKPPGEIWLDGHGISSAAFQAILEHIYMAETDLTLENVGEVYTAAKLLKIQSLQSLCEDLQDHFTPDNALIVLDLSGSNSIGSEAYQRALSVVTSSFHDVSQSETFLSLEVQRLREILGSDDLAVTSEIEVFQAALLWLKMDPACRMVHMQNVMSCVRFMFMEPDEIIRCTHELPSLLEDPKCREKIMAAHWFSNSRNIGCPCQLPDDMPKRRNFLLAEAKPPNLGQTSKADQSDGSSDDIMTSRTGSSNDASINSSEDLPLPAHSPRKKEGKEPSHQKAETIQPDSAALDTPRKTSLHVELPSAEERRRSASSGSAEECQMPKTASAEDSQTDFTRIALLGGMGTTEDCQRVVGSSVHVLDESSGAWTPHSKMPEPRYLHAAVVMNGALYVVGGADPSTEEEGSNTMFKMDLKTGVWSQVASMRHKRVYHGVCEMDRLLYVIGGQDESQRVLSSVEVYNAVTDSWVPVAPLVGKRLGMGVAPHKGVIYAAGGYCETCDKLSGKPVLSKVECFNPSTNRWIEKNPLRVPRCHGNLVEANGNLFLCGGATQSCNLDESVLTSDNTINIYDDDHDCWYIVHRLSTARHGATVAATDTKIYIFGGLNSSEGKALQSYECYNVCTSKLEIIADDMPWACIGTSAVLLSSPERREF